MQGLIAHPAPAKILAGKIITAIETKLGLLLKNRHRDLQNFHQRAELFLAWPARGQRISAVKWHYHGRTTVSKLSDNNGSETMVDKDGKYDVGNVLLPAKVKPHDVLTYELVVPKGSKVSTPRHGSVHVLPLTGWSVISDIDDTIRDSFVLDMMRLFQSTFTREFRPVPGINKAYHALTKKLSTKTNPAVFHYVSGSPISLLEPLQDFIKKYGFRQGPMHLQLTTLDSIHAIQQLQQILDFKVSVLSEIIKDFPKRKYVFIGDSGQTDPEVYGTIYRDMAQQKLDPPCVYIRAVSGVNADKEMVRNARERFLWAFRDVEADRWMVYNDSEELLAVDPRQGCYPKGKVNPFVPKGDEQKKTVPAKDKAGNDISVDVTKQKSSLSQWFHNLFGLLGSLRK